MPMPPPTTHFLGDILRQPSELQRTLDHLSGPGRRALDAAVAAVRSARHVYLTGIGSSWHAGLNVSALLQLGGGAQPEMAVPLTLRSRTRFRGPSPRLGTAFRNGRRRLKTQLGWRRS